MRLIRKINLALAGVVAASAVLNFAALQLTVMPSFLTIESEAAERNQQRVTEAIALHQDQVAHSVSDYAFWDDTLQYLKGGRPDYIDKNVTPASLQALGINYFAAIGGDGRIKLDRGFRFIGDEPEPIALLGSEHVPEGHPFRKPFSEPAARSGLMMTPAGIAAVAVAPVLNSERTGASPGNLVFGKLLDLEALREITKVDFQLLPGNADGANDREVTRGPETIEVRTGLAAIDGIPLGSVVSRTGRDVSAAGQNALLAAMSLLLLAGAALIGTLSLVLRRIAVRRIEAMRAHLLKAACSGELRPIPPDAHQDELSDAIVSFNQMAMQLAELRDRLRKEDYRLGAADQSAGILHNVRNAVSPIGTLAWDLARGEDAPWKQNLAKALQQLKDTSIEAGHAGKLRDYVVLSAEKLLTEGNARRGELQTLNTMVRHVDAILKEHDQVSSGERSLEPVRVEEMISQSIRLLGRHEGIEVSIDTPPQLSILAHPVTLEQVITNLLVNAVEAIEASGRGGGSIQIVADPSDGAPGFVDISIADNGDGIAPESLAAIFEKGFSTRRERSGGLGLHWCANTVNAMGGRMYAESLGRGRGATLHLIVRRAIAGVKEAA